MNATPSIRVVLPPRLTMDEYADFFESSQQESNPLFTERQKSLEKRIQEPFSMQGRTAATVEEKVRFTDHPCLLWWSERDSNS